MKASGELSELLTPEPASVGRARRLIEGAVTASGHGELVDVAALLVSEVVTNSVLHAGTEIRLRCQPGQTGVRIEVFDRSPLRPSVRHYDAQATTGRGLALVSALAASWGIRSDADGKTLWFELRIGEVPEEKSSSPEAVVEPPGRTEDPLEVHLRGASPPLVRATIEHGDALLRELAFIGPRGRVPRRPPRWMAAPTVRCVTDPGRGGGRRACRSGQGQPGIELACWAPTSAMERLYLVDHADALARQGRLLSAPALPEVAVCRHWVYSQIAEQAAGFAPRSWELPEQLEPARAAAGLAADEVERLQRATAATVVADDANRIIFVNEAAAELLGWVPEALVGQRLTVLIPPELREAHLAGFSRLQVTGEPRILGQALHVPALRRDGSLVDVVLIIEQLPGRGGRRAFRAVLAPNLRGGSEPLPR